MRPSDVIREAMGKSLVDEDGKPVRLELLPPLSDSEIDDFAKRLPCPLPPEIRELFSVCSGFEGSAVDLVDFTGARCLFAYEEAFPHGLPIAADGFGNFWVVDLVPTSETCGPIYFACHDAPVLLYQSPDLEHFLVELFKLSEPPHKSLVDDVHEDQLFHVWRDNPGVRSREECLASNDAEVRGFAKELDPSFEIVDLREPRIGFGFSWGRYGPNTVVRRYGSLPLFAYQKPQGMLERLFGGSAPRGRSSGGAEPMPWSSRLAVAAVAAAVAFPPVLIALMVLVLMAMGGGRVASIVWPAFLVLGSIWTYEIVSRIMRGKVDRHRFSATAVAIGTIGGYQAGTLMMMAGMFGVLLWPLVLAFAGALVGTYVPVSGSAATGGVGGDAIEGSDRIAVAAVAVAVALPPVALLVLFRRISGLDGGVAVPRIVWVAVLVLGSVWTSEIASRILRGRPDRHRFSIGAVSIGAMGGFLTGMLTMQTFAEPPLLALVGAFLGTFVPPKAQ